jgi:hypothetical protein
MMQRTSVEAGVTYSSCKKTKKDSLQHLVSPLRLKMGTSQVRHIIASADLLNIFVAKNSYTESHGTFRPLPLTIFLEDLHLGSQPFQPCSHTHPLSTCGNSLKFMVLLIFL